MSSAKSTLPLRCVTEFTRAIEVLNRTIFEIEKMYNVRLQLLFEDENLFFEIESSLTTVCCMLDHNLVCRSSYLFCDNDSDLKECVAYCNATFKALGHDSWVLPTCHIEYIASEVSCLVFIPKRGTAIKKEMCRRNILQS